MQKSSFAKGLIIGTLFSSFFWFCAYQAVTSLTENDISQESTIEISEITEVKASF